MSTTGLDPRTPIVIGVAQTDQRGTPDQCVEALRLMVQVSRAAFDDASAPGLAASLTGVWVVDGIWKYSDPGRLVAGHLGAASARSGRSTVGGNSPQMLVNRACLDLAAGVEDAVVIVGAETIWSRRRARRSGHRIPTTEQIDIAPDQWFGSDQPMSGELERERRVDAPIHHYAIFENALRARHGIGIDEQLDRVGRLWQGFNEVAVANPHAWRREPMSADEIVTPSDDNRMVVFPYTKAMCSNWDLDQAAALVITTIEVAEQYGVSRDRWVFPQAGTDASDTPHVTNRGSLSQSPAVRHGGRRLFELAGVGIDDLAYIDLYSCFPSAVQIAAEELGIGIDRQLTETGGLTFAGGPMNNYVTHSIATMVDRLRRDPGALGMCTANGGYLTKHSFGLYSTDPAPGGFRWSSAQPDVDAEPTVCAAVGPVVGGAVEGYTVVHDAAGPQELLAAVRTADGARTWAHSEDPRLMDHAMQTELVGAQVDVGGDGVLVVT